MSLAQLIPACHRKCDRYIPRGFQVAIAIYPGPVSERSQARRSTVVKWGKSIDIRGFQDDFDESERVELLTVSAPTLVQGRRL